MTNEIVHLHIAHERFQTRAVCRLNVNSMSNPGQIFAAQKCRDCRAIGRCVGVFRRHAAGGGSFYFTLP